jgi:hypothetical protein
VREGGDSGYPVILSQPDNPVSKALKMVSEDIAAKVSIAAMRDENVIPINMIG